MTSKRATWSCGRTNISALPHISQQDSLERKIKYVAPSFRILKPPQFPYHPSEHTVRFLSYVSIRGQDLHKFPAFLQQAKKQSRSAGLWSPGRRDWILSWTAARPIRLLFVFWLRSKPLFLRFRTGNRLWQSPCSASKAIKTVRN